MSKSRSSSPPTNTPNPNTSPISTSRPHLHESATPTERRSVPPEQPYASSSRIEAEAEPSTSRRRRADSPPAERPRMAKRLRRLSTDRALTHSSSSSSSEMGDTEDNSQHQPGGSPQDSTNPPKKKRTRTLTTPHQAAVLHALLAQSRFPTTAMREEVGRAIGLSARKVQIWFQNQRQKARRPQAQPDAVNRPPQYGPFPSSDISRTYRYGSAPELNTMPSEPSPMPQDRGYDEPRSGRPYSSYSPSEYYGEPSHLLGPGVPGPEARTSHSFSRGSPAHSPIAGPPSADIRAQRRSPSPIRPSSWSRSSRIHDPSRTLPPLTFAPTRPSTFPSGAAQSHRYRSDSPEQHIFAHRLPEPNYGPASGSSASSITSQLPPPFALQPAPQWDNSHLTPIPPSRESAWSRPESRSTQEPSSPVISTPVEPTQMQRGRYDPVRSTYVPYSTPPGQP